MLKGHACQLPANPAACNPAESTQDYVGQANNADELVQEVMIKVWQKASGFNPQKAAASTWIYTIARNCRTDMYRRLQKFDTPINSEDIWPDDETDELFVTVQQRRDEVRVRELLQELDSPSSHIL